MDLRLIVEGLDKTNTEDTSKRSPNLTPSVRAEVNNKDPALDAKDPIKTGPTDSIKSFTGIPPQNSANEQVPVIYHQSESLPDRYSHPKHFNPPLVVPSIKKRSNRATAFSVKEPLVPKLPPQQPSFQPEMQSNVQAQLLPQTQNRTMNIIPTHITPLVASNNQSKNYNGFMNEYNYPYGMTIYPSPPQAAAQPQLHMYSMSYPVTQPPQYVFDTAPIMTTAHPVTPQHVLSPGLSTTVQHVPVQTAPVQQILGPQLSQQISNQVHQIPHKAEPTNFTNLSSKLSGPFYSGIAAPTNSNSDTRTHSISPHHGLLPPPVLPTAQTKPQTQPLAEEKHISGPCNDHTSRFTSQRPNGPPSPTSVSCGNTCSGISSNTSSHSSTASTSSSQSSPASSPKDKRLIFEHAPPNSLKFWRFVDESKRTNTRPVVSASSLKDYIKVMDAESGDELDESAPWSSNKLKYGCKECGRSFFRKSDLVRHIQIHLGIKPNVCTICGKQFIQRSALTVHLRVHTGEKPFGCQKCGRNFSDSSSLARHRRIHQRNVQETANRIKSRAQPPLVEDTVI